MNQLPQQTVKRIEEEALMFVGKYDLPMELNPFQLIADAYIEGARLQAEKASQLVEALEQIANGQYSAGATNIATQALKNYKDQSSSSID